MRNTFYTTTDQFYSVCTIVCYVYNFCTNSGSTHNKNLTVVCGNFSSSNSLLLHFRVCVCA